ncbi:hypothetical protein PSENEW3_00006295 [Picochlorum sp. SENEW3]|nr:hypothetical protein PSENEW3_00006295 [Picochlorum sp. SENEW3]
MHVHRGGPMCASLQVFNICRRESQACHLFAENPAGGLGPAEPREAAVSDEICNPSMEVTPFDPCTYPLGRSNSADICYVQFLVNDVGADGSLVLHSADCGQAESIVQDALYWRNVALLVCPDFCTIAQLREEDTIDHHLLHRHWDGGVCQERGQVAERFGPGDCPGFCHGSCGYLCVDGESQADRARP